MTTATDTVFTVAPEVAVAEAPLKPVQCDVGASLRHEWMLTYNAYIKSHPNNDEGWIAIFGKGFMVYWNHRRACVQCTEYEFRNRTAE
jgi:hypothetical protein